MALGGQAGLGDPSADDRMQRLVDIRSLSFLRNADSELKIQECRPNPTFFNAILGSVPGWRLLRKLIRAVSNLWKCSGHPEIGAKNRAVSGVSASSLSLLLRT